MWAQYKKTAVYMQVLVLLIVAFAYFFAHRPLVEIGVIFVVMQLGAVVGAWWGARLTGKLNRRVNDLPIKPKN